jgi:uncharacterized protein (TIGR03067 family)
MLQVLLKSFCVYLLVAESLCAVAQEMGAQKWDDRLNGPWHLESEFAGEERDVMETVVYFSNGHMCWSVLEGKRILVFGYTAIVDTTRSPHHIELKEDGEPNVKRLGIYRFDGNRLFFADGKERPESFKKVVDKHLTPSSHVPHIYEFTRGFATGPGHGLMDQH